MHWGSYTFYSTLANVVIGLKLYVGIFYILPKSTLFINLYYILICPTLNSKYNFKIAMKHGDNNTPNHTILEYDKNMRSKLLNTLFICDQTDLGNFSC